ncbi:MAG: hypothetical protein JO161_04375 [Planctomycetaceae bacterium]|nr:hypothetical protein [Planctomycetaceae bacterium]
MTAFKNLVFGVLVWTLLGAGASAAPMSSWTPGAWAWWSTGYANPTASGGTANQIANSMSSPQTIVAASDLQSSVAASSAPLATPDIAGSSASAPAASATSTADAFINLGQGPYPLASQITTGNAQPWYNSSAVSSFFGGTPSAQQIASFDNTILQRVQQTFQQSGVNVSLTTDPTVPANHTLSLVSNTASNTDSSVIGMTQVTGHGFSFFDQEAKSAQTLDQLQWIVAHNISHELMLAFGVGENYDQSGNYIDARNANWSMMVSPSATFSPAAAQALIAALASNPTSSSGVQEAQVVDGTPVPEPTTVAIWASGLLAATVLSRKRGG